MSREWKPGDVAVGTVRGVANVRVMRSGDRRTLWRSAVVGGLGVDSMQWHGEEHIADLRPLVVIDPEDREQVERLYRAYVKAAPIVDNGYGKHLQAALRSLIAPPKPEEPTGLGAVVEDADGHRFTRISVGNLAPWHAVKPRTTDRPYRYWDGIDAVRVLSEGVTE